MPNDIAIDLLGQRDAASAEVPITRWASERGGEAPHVRSLYVHVPFCFHKCHYCDFYSVVDTRDRMAPFCDRLETELDTIAHATGRPALDTIFIGGGTPTLLPPELLSRVLGAIGRAFEIRAGAEWTIEVNPETLCRERAQVLAENGVNRVSIGAQSFHRAHLATLERHHDPDTVERAIEHALASGIERISVDLIYAIPGQTLGEWAGDLERALALPIEHLSAYALTYEPNTPMTARLHAGEFDPAPDTLEVAMYDHTLHEIRGQGFDRYEVSNHAKPGAACRHNLAYWRGDNWLAAGPGAAGHLGGHRWTNTPRLDDYIRSGADGFAPIREHETPDPTRMLLDRIMMGIRTRDGLDAESLRRDAADLGKQDALDRRAAWCRAHGWLEDLGDTWTLTDGGYHFADRVAAELMDAVSSPDGTPLTTGSAPHRADRDASS